MPAGDRPPISCNKKRFWFGKKRKSKFVIWKSIRRGLFLQVGTVTKSINFALHGLKEWMSSKKVRSALSRQQM